MDSSSSMKVPNLSQADLANFYEAHFGQSSVANFEHSFLSPQNHDSHNEQEFVEEEDEDDGLGYYSDGVKRTLTDEQIAIFRHSEEEALRRAAEKAVTSSVRVEPLAKKTSESGTNQELEEGEEPDDEGVVLETAAPSKKKSKKRKGFRERRGDPKPDLRKRTWDVVDKGLGGLDYDEMEAVQAAAPQLAKRRQISYEEISYDD